VTATQNQLLPFVLVGHVDSQVCQLALGMATLFSDAGATQLTEAQAHSLQRRSAKWVVRVSDTMGDKINVNTPKFHLFGVHMLVRVWLADLGIMIVPDSVLFVAYRRASSTLERWPTSAPAARSANIEIQKSTEQASPVQRMRRPVALQHVSNESAWWAS
jgi:hypothetical protein